MLLFKKFRRMALGMAVGLALIRGVPAMAATPQTELLRWQQAAGQAGDAAKGQVFFGQRHGGAWSCASCHAQPPTRDSQHASTGKTIAALAPAFNAERLADSGKVRIPR